jgi:orotate phosphoribosyltransferase-like protein
MVTEKNKKAKIKPELVKAIKEFFGAGLTVNEVANKLSVPYQTAYYYSPKRKARVRRQAKASPVTGKRALNAAVRAKIDELTAQRDIIDAQIKALESVV